jgi:hypothetical protein
MTVITPEGAARPAAAPGPCLTAAPGAGTIIAGLFALTIVLFLVGLLAFV